MQNAIIEATTSLDPCFKLETLPSKIIEYADEISLVRAVDVYLAGSSVHNLLRHDIANTIQDYDYVVFDVPELWQQITSFGSFIRNKKLDNHFIRNTHTLGGVSADLIIKPDRFNTDSLDFTICGLLILVSDNQENRGNVYDLTGRGLNDLYNNVLDTIDLPLTCFQRDPICVLRTIKYIARGFNPSERLDEALYVWSDYSCYQNQHFIDVLRKLLESPYNLQYIELMQRYNILQKIRFSQYTLMGDNETICRSLLRSIYFSSYVVSLNQNHHGVKKISKMSQYYQYLVNNVRYTADSAGKDDAEILTLSENIKTARENMQAQKEQQKHLAMLKKDLASKQLITSKLEEEFNTLTANMQKKISKQLAKTQQALESEYKMIQQNSLHKIDENSNIKQVIAQLDKKQEALTQQVQVTQVSIDELNTNLAQAKLILEQKKSAYQQNKIALNELTADVAVIVQPENEVDINAKLLPIYKKLMELDLLSLEVLFARTFIPELVALLAYQLGCIAEYRDNYFLALYYFKLTYDIFADFQNVATRITNLKERYLNDINWYEGNTSAWFTLGVNAQKDKKYDEAVLYFTMALDVDRTYINAYIRRINIFYLQKRYKEFVLDYRNLRPLIYQRTRDANLLKIHETLKKNILKIYMPDDQSGNP